MMKRIGVVCVTMVVGFLSDFILSKCFPSAIWLQGYWTGIIVLSCYACLKNLSK